MEQLVDAGLVRSIGISNFNSRQVARLLENCRIKPVNNQVIIWFFTLNLLIFYYCTFIYQLEVSPQFNNRKLVDFCNERNIIVTAYCPLGRPIPAEKKPTFLYSKELADIASRHRKTPAQIVLRYLVCHKLKTHRICINNWFCRSKSEPFQSPRQLQPAVCSRTSMCSTSSYRPKRWK